MNQNQVEPFIFSQPINTHSLIQLPLPDLQRDKNYSFQWFSHKQNNYSNPIADSYIFTRFDLTKISKTAQYQCNPLDADNIIIARVLSQREDNYELLKQYRYGPVAIQSQAAEYMKDSDQISAKMVISKNNILQVSIHIGTPVQILKPSDQKVYITLEAQNFRFELSVDKNIRLPSSNSFFKFYDKEDNTLGISMYHQHSQFMQKLKGIRVFSHFGFYIKLYFKDRLNRDAFLFKIIQSFEIESSPLPKMQKISEIKIVVTESNVIKHEEEQCPVDAIRKSIGQRNHQIDEQIYKLLYQASQRGDQLSLDMADAQFLLASSKKLDLNNSKILKQLKDSHCSSLEKKSQFLTQKNANRPQSGKSYQFACFNSEKIMNQTNTNKRIEKIDQQCIKNMSNTFFPKEGNQNYLRSTITRLTTQVQNLLKQNKKLAQENKKLRDENMRLRFKEIKNASHKYLNKMSSISKNASKQLIKVHNDNISISVSPLKSTLQYQLPKMYRPSESQCRPNVGNNTVVRRQHRNFTTLINKVMPTQSTSFIMPAPMIPLALNSPTHSQFNNKNNNKISNFQMMSDATSKDCIKQQPHTMTPSQLTKNARTKQKIWLPKSPSPNKKSFECFQSTKRIGPASPKIQYQSPNIPSFSQIIPAQMVKSRGFGTTSTHYTTMYHR